MPAKRMRHKKIDDLPAQAVSYDSVLVPKKTGMDVLRYQEEKLSNHVLKLLAPYREEFSSLDDFKNMVATTCLAWNLSNLTQEHRREQIELILAKMDEFPGDLRNDFELTILELIDKKIAFFPQDDRTILDFIVTETSKQYRLAIKSTNSPQPGSG